MSGRKGAPSVIFVMGSGSFHLIRGEGGEGHSDVESTFENSSVLVSRIKILPRGYIHQHEYAHS